VNRPKSNQTQSPWGRARAHAPRWAIAISPLLMLFLVLTLLPSAPPTLLASPHAGPAPLSPATFPTPIQHVFTIFMENQVLPTVLAQGPYQNYLYTSYAGASEYYGVCHPSTPNYLSVTGGQSRQCGSDKVTSYSAQNVADLVTAKGETWADYDESMPTACDRSDGGGYVAHHDPFIYYQDIVSNRSLCNSHVLPLSSFNASETPPNYVFISPNGHDNGNLKVIYGDEWLRSFLQPLLNESWAASTVFFITYDEGTFPNGQDDPSGYDGLDGGHIYFVAVSPYTKGQGVYTADASDFNLLATTEWLLGTGNLSQNDASSNFPAMQSMFNFGPPPPARYEVSGVVDSPNGSGVANDTVYANASGNSTTAVTNQSGGFNFHLTNGTYSLSVTDQGWSPAVASVVVAGAPVENLTLDLEPVTVSVSGVVDSLNGTAIAGATVYANSTNASSVAVTNQLGGFEFQLANGSYALTSNVAGWSSDDANLTVNGTPVAGVVLTLSPVLYEVRGIVLDAVTGAPIANATVVVRVPGPHLHERTNLSGQFEVELPTGVYPVHIWAFLYGSINATLTVGPSDLFASFNLTLLPVFSVRGTISATDGVPLTDNVTIVMTTTNGSLEFPVQNGSFSLSLPNGTYQMEVLAPGFAPAIIRVVVSGGQAASIRLVLAAVGVLAPASSALASTAIFTLMGGVAVGVCMWLLTGNLGRGRPPSNRGRRRHWAPSGRSTRSREAGRR
jgi:phosphatidylinositol-3-phosphatase